MAMERGIGCRCPEAEAAFGAGFQAGAEFVLGMIEGQQGEIAHAVARAVMLTRAVGEPITAELIMGALAQALAALDARVALLMESERRSALLAAMGNGRGRAASGQKEGAA